MKKIQSEIVQNLIWAATGYGKAGLAFLNSNPGFGKNSQVAIGNMAIAIELLLKAFIANHTLLLLYKGLPVELRCALLTPELMPPSFRKAPYEIELKSSSYNSIELDEAITTFGIYCPELKKQLGAHFKFLSRHRNTCVHASFPDCREYEVERTAFLLLTLVDQFKKQDSKLIKTYVSFGDKDQNAKFLARFDEERLNRVHSKIEKAREKAKSLTDKLSLSPTEWDWYPIECPVCGSDAALLGETEAETEYDHHEGISSTILTFAGESFECKQCGLVLEDYDELKIAGIDPDVDRSDEEQKWYEDNYNPYDDRW